MRRDKKMFNINKLYKSLFSAIMAFGLLTSTAMADRDEDYAKIVVQMSSNDARAQGRTLKRVGWIMDSFKGKATLEVVSIGPAFSMLAKDGKFAKKVSKLMKRGVVFTADASIQKMMKKHKLPTDLVAGVKHVKVGPAHIVKLQMQDYKYLALFF